MPCFNARPLRERTCTSKPLSTATARPVRIKPRDLAGMVPPSRAWISKQLAPLVVRTGIFAAGSRRLTFKVMVGVSWISFWALICRCCFSREGRRVSNTNPAVPKCTDFTYEFS